MPLKFSQVIAGTMTWGAWGKQLTTNEMISLMHHCIENEITSFDHADIYGGYTNEADFGKAFAESSIKRESIQLISKCGIMYKCANRDYRVKHYCYKKGHIIQSVEQSLLNLKTDYLDAILFHRPSPLMEPYEIMEAIAKLAQEGKIKDFGVSNFTPSQVELVSSQVPVTINQIEFSLTQYSAFFDGSLDQMMIKQITPMAWSPLGVVFRNVNEQTGRILRKLGEYLDKYNATEAQMLLAWIMKHPANIIPVVGTTNKDRLAQSINAAKIDLDTQDWFDILEASMGEKMP